MTGVPIVGGDTCFPQDLEALAAAAHPAFAGGRALAWPPEDDEDGVTVLVGTAERDPDALAAAVRAAGTAVADAFPGAVRVYAVPYEGLPRTTGGASGRRACPAGTVAGLPLLAGWPAPPRQPEALPLLRQVLADLLEMEPHTIDPDVPVSDYGIDSISGGLLVAEVRRRCGVAPHTEFFFGRLTLGEMAGELRAALS
ncbi:phosphopantetheine-binding protein [Streptomyces sp. NPDC059002]|uniref:phosphopantetheine-binding protein n=1 Tax=Streptomyces sp. NPDC059002 TaxID=3346690 RepID=UPI00369F76FD